jgi:hypothetical protein
MTYPLAHANPLANHVPDDWLGLVFRAKAVDKGGIVRRSTLWVEREVGRNRFIDAVRSRGFHLVENGGQFIVICNHGALRVIC